MWKNAMIKDIVVNLGADGRAGNYAVSTAAAFNAHVLGVAFSYQPMTPATPLGGFPPEIVETQRREATASAQRALTLFEEAARREGVAHDKLMMDKGIADAADLFTQLARRFDLAVTGQAEPNTGGAEEIVAESVLFGAGRPVILVPYIQKQGLQLDRVMVCWDGSRAAARAIGDATPLLAKAGQVTVVIVANEPGKHDEVAGADLGRHLARHNLKVEVKRLTTSSGMDVANALLSYAADIDATFLVMGGYGHSRLREFVLGGVTRTIFSSLTVPALLSH
jgi:nucleotide-binding universal stress UspA family protein